MIILLLMAIGLLMIESENPKPKRRCRKFGDGLLTDVNPVDQSYAAGNFYQP